MTVNVAVALLSTLQVASRETSSEPGDLRGAAVEKIMQEMLRVRRFTPNLTPMLISGSEFRDPP